MQEQKLLEENMTFETFGLRPEILRAVAEKKYTLPTPIQEKAIPFVLSSVFLFALGALIAYLTLPKGLGFLLGFAGSGFTPLITGDRFLGFVMLLAVAFGVSFEFPIVLIFLCGVGVISSDKLRQWRRGAILFIAVFAAVITPSADPYTMLAMMLPMVLFYEAAIIVARLMNK